MSASEDTALETALDTLLAEDIDPSDTIRTIDDPPAGYVKPSGDSTKLDHALSLGRVLGQGGMAVVREAEQRVLQRAVAVKSARPGRRKSSDQLVLEARITGALEHPGILPIHDIVLDGSGDPHIVMQRVDGTPWSQVMDDADQLAESFGVSDVLAWNLGVLEAVCNAVHFAHSQGVIHRDLKPENVMVGPFGQVYVVDWGVAVSVREGDSRFPLASTQRRIVGTPRYMGPELARGDGRLVTERTDVYLLGAVLYRIIEGRPPHRGLAIREILARIPDFEPSFAEDTPAELGQLVSDAMQADPADRIESAEVFRRRIRAYLEHRGSARLARQAEERLTELEDVLAGEEPERVQVYDLFGAIRFGFREAIATWPENEAAEDGLQRAALLLARWELEQGDDRAAEVLMGALEEVPGDLAERFERVREERLANAGLLARLARDRDPTRGRGIRMALVLFLGAVWSVTPIITANSGDLLRIAVPTFWFLFITGALVFGRRVWQASIVNRRTATLLFAGVVGQTVLMLGAFAGAMPISDALVAQYVLKGTLLMVAAMQVDRWFAASAATFFLGYLVHVRFPELRPYSSAVAHGSIAIVAGYVWWPRSR